MIEQEDHVKLLLELKETLETLIKSKSEQIESLKKEIEILQAQIVRIGSQISTQSFRSAASLLDPEVLSKSKKQLEPETSPITKKIFSAANEILANFQFEKHTVFVRFPKPKLANITHERYLEGFVKKTLMNIINKEPKLAHKFTKTSECGVDLVDTITLQNITQYDSFEEIFEGVQQLLTKPL